MTLSHARRSGGRGFTLVELLIVIAIISVLVSLLSSAVGKAVITAHRVRNQNEISQLATAVENFKQKFGIYPPSRILLGETLADYFQNGNLNQPKSQFHLDSYTTLTTMFPRLNFKSSFFIDWDGSRTYTQPVILEGDQCLVFFLGGVPQFDQNQNNRPFCSGFSTNPADPTYHVTHPGSDTIPPFFDFDSGRLAQRKPSRYLSYLDTWANSVPAGTPYSPANGMPYAYFSSYKTRNGYNRFYGPPNNLSSSDCATLSVWPYAEGPTSPGAAASPSNWRYLNPNTFQIISAGRNFAFGQGTNPNPFFAGPFPFWSPPDRAGNTEASRGKGDLPPNPPQAGTDDQSNFYDSTLGAGS